MNLTFAIGSWGLVVAAGASVAFQQVLNAQLRTQLGSPWWAGVVSYAVGTLAMLAVACVAPGPRPAWPGAGPGWLAWAGGVFGAVFIATSIWMVPRLGAATVLALVVVGQLAAALLLDHLGLMGLTPQPVTATRLLGLACLVLGAVLVRA